MSVEIRHAVTGDSDAILRLLARAMGWGSDDRFRRYFVWKHLENPFGTSPTWVAEVDGRIVGLRTWLRWRLTDGVAMLRAVRAVDTATDPAMRGRGVFRRLTEGSLAALEADGTDLVFNTPNAASGAGYRTMGWRDVGTLPVAVRFGSLRGATDGLRSRQAAERWSVPCSVGVDARDAVAEGDILERFGAPPADGRLATPIDTEFLAWRYGLADLRYRLFEHGDSCAFFRLRRRGRAVECVIGHVLGVDRTERRRLIARLSSTAGADRTLVLDPTVGPTCGFLRVPGVGPLLMARPLRSPSVPPLDGWALSLGDVELF